jgi:hypothetical protein
MLLPLTVSSEILLKDSQEPLHQQICPNQPSFFPGSRQCPENWRHQGTIVSADRARATAFGLPLSVGGGKRFRCGRVGLIGVRLGPEEPSQLLATGGPGVSLTQESK